MLLRIKLLEIHFERVSNWLWLVDQSEVKKKKSFWTQPWTNDQNSFQSKTSFGRGIVEQTQGTPDRMPSWITTVNNDQEGRTASRKTVTPTGTLCYQASAVGGFRPRRPGFRKSLFSSWDSWYHVWRPQRKLGRPATSKRTAKVQDGEDVDVVLRVLIQLTVFWHIWQL